MKDLSIEYAHIYTNDKINDEHKLSLDILKNLKVGNENVSLVILVDDYSFPDPSFDYESFVSWLTKEGRKPDLVFRESQLISTCDEVLKLVKDKQLRSEIEDYIKTKKKYPCSLFVAAWYLLRLGYISSPLFDRKFIARELLNILPQSFEPFEKKAFEIISSTDFLTALQAIKYKYFEGRLIA